jgi:hypothetical protein
MNSLLGYIISRAQVPFLNLSNLLVPLSIINIVDNIL